MKWNWRSIFIVAGLGLGVGMVAPSCVVRAAVRPAYVVDQQPPAPQYQTPAARSGFLWVQGNWEWRNSQWKWKRGHWVRARAGHTYTAGRWERRGNRWHFVRGRWVAGAARPAVRDHRTPAPAPGPTVRDHRTPAPAAYPTAAPPAPRYATPGTKAGFVWIRGHYEWRNGGYAWTKGHWERQKASQVWTPGRWAAQNGRWVWTPGSWGAAPAAGPKVRDHRTKPAPAGRKNEVVPARRGVPR